MSNELIVSGSIVKPQVSDSTELTIEKIEASPINNAFRLRGERILCASGNLQSLIHDYMIDLMSAIHTQNASYHLITEFYNGLGKGVNKKALKDWIVSSSPLLWNEEQKMFKRTKKAKWDEAKLIEADDIPYFEFAKISKPKTPSNFDSSKKIKFLIKSIEKTIAEFNSNGVDSTTLSAILLTLK